VCPQASEHEGDITESLRAQIAKLERDLLLAQSQLTQTRGALSPMSTLSSLMGAGGVVAYNEFAASLDESFGAIAVSALNSACGGNTEPDITTFNGGNNLVYAFTLPAGSFCLRAIKRPVSLSAALELQTKLNGMYAKLVYDAAVVVSRPPAQVGANDDKYFVFVVTPHHGDDLSRLLLTSSPQMQHSIVCQLQCFLDGFPILLPDAKPANFLGKYVGHVLNLKACDFDEALLSECSLARKQALFCLIAGYFSGNAIPAVVDGIMDVMRFFYYVDLQGCSSPSDVSRFLDGALVHRLTKNSSLASSYRVALDMAVKDAKLRRYFHDHWYFLLHYLLETIKAHEKSNAESRAEKHTPLADEFATIAKFLNEKASSGKTRMEEIKYYLRFDGTLFVPFAVEQRKHFAQAAMTFIFNIGFALSKSARLACDEYTKDRYDEKNKWHLPPSRDEGWSDPAVYKQSGISLYSLKRSLERLHSVLTSDSYRRDSHARTDARLYATSR
jgi:hypothetical protein